MNYPTCRTCKHWLSDKFAAPFGACSNVSDEVGELSESGAAYCQGHYEEGATLMVHPDKFGCNLHEPLTEEKEG